MKLRGMLIGSLVVLFSAGAAWALEDDLDASLTQPAAALVAPFDSVDGMTYLAVSQPPGGKTLATHWVFWSESCDHLADVWICLTAGDTVVVDSTNIQAIDDQNQPVGPVVDLTGERGFVTVTAFDGSESCQNPPSPVPVDDAIVGFYTIADPASGASFGLDMVGFGLTSSAPSRVELPELTLQRIDLQTFNPEMLDQSEVMLIALQEGSGGAGAGGVELAPLTGVSSDVSFFDNLEVPLSLPGVRISCALFGPLVGTLIPPAIVPGSSGLVRLEGPNVGGQPIGGHTWLIGFLGMRVGNFGTATNGRYPIGVPPPTLSPTPVGTPSPTAEPTAVPTPSAAPTATPTPALTATPASTATPGATPTAGPTPTAVRPRLRRQRRRQRPSRRPREPPRTSWRVRSPRRSGVSTTT
jgi:hypothetical protein